MTTRSIVILVSIAASTLAHGASLPSQVLDLDAWKLTLPFDTERKGNPDEVVQPELERFRDPTCFHTSDSGDAVIFRASCDGLGTTNSNYPRSELREMDRRGKDEASWGTDDGSTHVLETEQAITNVPKRRPHVVCAQIHDAEDDILMVRLEGTELFIEREGANEIELDPDYQLGERFKLRIVADGGRIKVWYNDEQKMDWKAVKGGCYFKVGCYTQSNRKRESRPGSYGEVILYRLDATHQE